MEENKILVSAYTSAEHSAVLNLLLELHSTYFIQSTTLSIQQIHQEHNLKKSYEEYLDSVTNNKDGNWLTLIAKSEFNNVVGFIIGSIETDDALLLNKIGKFEDWFVSKSHRGQGIGMKLYQELEKWFVEKGCKQVRSETWQGNELSIKAHQQLGFFISGISFSKKL
jgi:ribosomal protein S18 acetylase RimI-like enzyme